MRVVVVVVGLTSKPPQLTWQEDWFWMEQLKMEFSEYVEILEQRRILSIFKYTIIAKQLSPISSDHNTYELYYLALWPSFSMTLLVVMVLFWEH